MLNNRKRLHSGYVLVLFLGCWIGAVFSANAFTQNQRSIQGDEFNRNGDYKSSKTERSNNADYSLTLKRMTRKAALETIADKADLTLAYCSDLFEESATVSVMGSEMNFERVIRKVLKGSGLGFKITGSRHLVVYKKEKANVAGKVVDKATGMPLQGARVMLIDQNENSSRGSKIKRASFVSSSGKYRIKDVDPGTYKLVIAYFGYNKAFEHVHVDQGTTVGNFKIVEKDK